MITLTNLKKRFGSFTAVDGLSLEIHKKEVFAGYPVTIQGLTPPTHAISALNKTLIINMDLMSILPEIIAIIVLMIIYFFVGANIFNHLHLSRY